MKDSLPSVCGLSSSQISCTEWRESADWRESKERNTNRNPAQIPKEDSQGGSRFLISTMPRSSVTCIWSFCRRLGKIFKLTIRVFKKFCFHLNDILTELLGVFDDGWFSQKSRLGDFARIGAGKKAWRAVDDLAKFDFLNAESNRLDTSDSSATAQIRFERHMSVCRPESRWWKIECTNNYMRHHLGLVIVNLLKQESFLQRCAKCHKIHH